MKEFNRISQMTALASGDPAKALEIKLFKPFSIISFLGLSSSDTTTNSSKDTEPLKAPQLQNN